MGYAASLQAGDVMCATAQMGEMMCCPTEEIPVALPVTGGPEPQVGMGDMCSFCPDGLTMPAETATPGDSSCGAAMGYAASLQADDAMCATVLMAEALCCPTGEMPVTDVVPDTATPTTEPPPGGS